MQSLNILLVDDDPISNYINHRLIKKFKFVKDIIVKANGEDALAYLKECFYSRTPLPSLIFLDLNMPVLDGFEFLKKYLNCLPSAKKTKVVVLSSSSAPSDIKMVYELGVKSYFSKPLNEKSLESILSEI